MARHFSRRVLLLIAALLGGTLVYAGVATATQSPKPAPAKPVPTQPAPGKAAPVPTQRMAEIGAVITQLTGVAISPLLGVSLVGAWDYVQADDAQRANLPWYAKPQFWVPMLLLVGIVAFKDTIGAMVPVGWKKPLDVMETMENKFSGLIAAGLFVPIVVDKMGAYLTAQGPALQQQVVAAGFTGFAAIDVTWLLNLLTVPLGIAIFLCVWLTSHVVNVLILISPWGTLDAGLKAFRTSVMAALAGLSALRPEYAVLLSLLIIAFSALIAGWAFRYLVFGWVFAWDFLTLRKRRFTPDALANWCFAGRKLGSVPIRTYGRLVMSPTREPVFFYRPWLVLGERTKVLPADHLVLGCGLVHPIITHAPTADGRPLHLITFPPRYRGHEPQLAATYGVRETREVGLLRAWAWLKEALGFGSAPSPAPAAAPAGS